jgi:hypothetical protein
MNNSSVNNQLLPVDAIRILGIHKRAGEPLVSSAIFSLKENLWLSHYPFFRMYYCENCIHVYFINLFDLCINTQLVFS